MNEQDRLEIAGPGHSQRGLAPSEVLFLLSLPLALVAVIYSGTLSFKEGQRLEVAKANGQEVVKWAEAAASSLEKGEASVSLLCSAVPPVESASAASAAPAASEAQNGSTSSSSADKSAAAASAPAITWGKCRQALVAQGGPLAEAENPFNPKESVLGTKCERDKPMTRGQVVVEKGTPPPPGFPGSVAFGSIEDSEPLVKGLTLKILVCDKGSYPIKVSEVKL